MSRPEPPAITQQRALIAVLVAVALAAAGGSYAIGMGTDSDADEFEGGTIAPACTTAALRVDVTPEVADLVEAQLAEATRANPCHRFEVTSIRSANVANRIRSGRVPNVWVADSTVWLDRTTAGSDGSTVDRDWVARGSLAESPVILANPVTSPHKLSGKVGSWADLINKSGNIHLADPHLDTASRLAYLASHSAAAAKDVTAGQRIILMSRFAASTTVDLLAGAVDPSTSSTARSEPFPISEQALATFTRGTPGLLSPVVPQLGTISLDYPWVPSPDLAPDLAEVAEAGYRSLTSDSAQASFAAAGFRTSTDADGPVIEGVPSVAVRELSAPPAATRLQALRQWDILKADSRMLVIIDVSGSMTTVARDTGGKTRAKVAEESMITAVRRLPGGSKVGGWIFSTDKGGKGKDWVPIAPIARLDDRSGSGTHRDALVAAVQKFPSYISGDTGLYDTTAAALTEMNRTYDPDYVNSVVIITDGKNDDPGGGLSLDELLAQIKTQHDPTRPVRVITIGMGEADTRALRTISTATGGTSYSANTPDDLLTVFVQALLSRETVQAP